MAVEWQAETKNLNIFQKVRYNKTSWIIESTPKINGNSKVRSLQQPLLAASANV